MYDIEALRLQQVELAEHFLAHFINFFERHNYNVEHPSVVSKDIGSYVDINRVPYGAGFYLILTDYMFEANPCNFRINGLKAIYRGHSRTVKNRLRSHLDNRNYRSNLPDRGVRYDVCMKLGGENGINVSEPPYNEYRWCVLVHTMPNSSMFMRMQAEFAFDRVFGRPFASKELQVVSSLGK